MGYYEGIRKEINIDQNIVSGALHPNGIYLFGENYYDKKIHGKKYDDWDYPRIMSVTAYIPTLREKGDEWFQKFIDDATRLVAITNVKGTDLLGVCNKNFVIRQKNITDGYKGFELIGRVISTQGAVTDMTMIDDVVYASASGGQVFQHINNKKWKLITNESVSKHFDNDNFVKGFLCIDGFSRNEIYAGGDNGIVWLYENKQWRPLDLPTKHDIKQIICADDDFVYLNCERYILKGRKDKWQKISIPKKLQWQHSVEKIAWFKGTLYVLPMFASVYGMAEYRDNKLQPLTISDNVFIPGGINDMVANDDLLMITGDDKVIIFNGERWFVVFDKNQSEEQLREQGIFYDPREL